MADFVLKEVSENNINFELAQIGFDKTYIFQACDKFRYKNIKIFNLSVAQANILKQTALIFGADCGVNRDVITGKIEKSDVILCGSYAQLKKIAQKLKHQPFSLSLLADKILKHLDKQDSCTKIVGILNITPDSFSDGGMYFQQVDAQKHLLSLIEDGADMIDIGAESARPYSTPVSSEEQIKRLKPILEFIKRENIKIPISIDTRSSVVADFALNMGVNAINDVSGLEYDANMLNVISNYNTTIVIQHTKGTPQNMQNFPKYNNVIEEIFLSLKNKIALAKDKGINNIIIDPGIGFGKSRQDNFKILNNIEELFSLDFPLMIGISRKSLLGIQDNDNYSKDALSAALAYPLIIKGINYLRVHNVKLHKHLLAMYKNI